MNSLFTPPAGDLSGRTILLQVVPYFGLDQVIIQALRRRGAVVDHLVDRPYQSAAMHAVAKFARESVANRTARLYRSQLAEWGRSHYDHILIVNGQTMSDAMLAELKQRFPRACMTFYIWDSFENKPYAVRSLHRYDRALSFDPDARSHGLRLRPLFYAPEFDLAGDPPTDFDLSFIGTAHSDRPSILAAIDRELGPNARTFWYQYLKAPWVLNYQRLVNPAFHGLPRTAFRFEPMPRATVRDVFARSRGIVDIEHDRQRGLTIRTFETLGARKKLLTTNAGIRDTEFYRPENIAVIDRHRPHVDPEFLRTAMVELPQDMRYRYSVDGWIDDVLGLTVAQPLPALQ